MVIIPVKLARPPSCRLWPEACDVTSGRHRVRRGYNHHAHGRCRSHVAYFSHHIDRRLGILISPTMLASRPLSLSRRPIGPPCRPPDCPGIVHGVCVSPAHLGEHCSTLDAGGAFPPTSPGMLPASPAGFADQFGPQRPSTVWPDCSPGKMPRCFAYLIFSPSIVTTPFAG